ncbi:hypothetical protein [Bacillus gobiensis]|nr:hypothetical protein [Bacillus gobiensis]
MDLLKKMVVVAMALTLLVSGSASPISNANAKSTEESSRSVEQMKF